MLSILLLASAAASPAVARRARSKAYNSRAISPISTSDLTASTLFERASSCSGAKQSCSTSTTTGTCCLNAPGGVLVQTQFWDYDASVSEPTTSWTIHGLWPDNCDGTYDETCDSRSYDIGTLMKAHAPADYTYMTNYWLDEDGDNEEFWEHEWTTHGTCVSVVKKDCYSSDADYYSGQEAVLYFKRAIALFKTLTTYDFLEAAGITPSTSKTYTLAALNAAAKSGYGQGVAPQFQCSGSNLDAVYWFFNTIGNINGTFVPVAPVGSSSCPSSGIVYTPKSGSGSGGSGGGGGGGSGGSGSGSAPSSGDKGNLNVVDGSSQTGCLLSYGTWSLQTCATYTATTKGSGFSLEGSKGYCEVSGGTLSCEASASAASTFTFADDGTMSYNGKSTFYSSSVPSGSDQETVSTSSGSETISIVWGASS